MKWNLNSWEIIHFNVFYGNQLIFINFSAMHSQLHIFHCIPFCCNMVGIVQTSSATCFQNSKTSSYQLLRIAFHVTLYVSNTMLSSHHTWTVIFCSVWLLYDSYQSKFICSSVRISPSAVTAYFKLSPAIHCLLYLDV